MVAILDGGLQYFAYTWFKQYLFICSFCICLKDPFPKILHVQFSYNSQAVSDKKYLWKTFLHYQSELPWRPVEMIDRIISQLFLSMQTSFLPNLVLDDDDVDDVAFISWVVSRRRKDDNERLCVMKRRAEFHLYFILDLWSAKVKKKKKNK